MRDRQRLSQDGFIVALIPVNKKQQLVGEPQIVSRGFVHLDDGRGICWTPVARRSSGSTSVAAPTCAARWRNCSTGRPGRGRWYCRSLSRSDGRLTAARACCRRECQFAAGGWMGPRVELSS